MPNAGVRSTDLPIATALDEFIGNAHLSSDMRLARAPVSYLIEDILARMTPTPATGGAVRAANAAALPAYNYVSGVMTAQANGAFPSLDGVSLSVGDRFWHWDHTWANGANVAYGLYVLSDAGSVSSKWVATRASDADTAAELGRLSAFVRGGTVNGSLTLAVAQTSAFIDLHTTAVIVAVVADHASAGMDLEGRSITASGQSLAGSTQTNVASFAVTWNTPGVAQTAIKLDLTDTDSLVQSRLVDLRVGGGSVFNIDKSGGIVIQKNDGTSLGGIARVGSAGEMAATSQIDPNTGLPADVFRWYWEDSNIGSQTGSAAVLRGMGQNRFSIESGSALVHISNTSRFEWEGLGASTLIFTGYQAGSSIGRAFEFTNAGQTPTLADVMYLTTTDLTKNPLTIKYNSTVVGKIDGYGALTLTGGTVTTNKPLINLSQTWNAGGVTFEALNVNITDTASAAASLLANFQIGGASKAVIDKAGNIGIGVASPAAGIDFSRTFNGYSRVQITNPSNGVKASAGFSLFNDLEDGSQIMITSSTFTGNDDYGALGSQFQNAFWIDAAYSLSGGIVMVARNGPLVFFSGDRTTEQLKIASGTGNATFNGFIKSKTATGGIGYATGAGGTVTQATSRTTGVTLNKATGQITTNTTSLAAGASATFTVTNSAVAATDTIIASIASGQTNKETRVTVSRVAAGAFDLTIMNNHASTAEVGASVINFAVIKGVAA